MTEKKTVIGIMEAPVRDPKNKAKPVGDSKLIGRFELDVALEELMRNRQWKADIMAQCKAKGYVVHSPPSVLRTKKDGCDVIVTVMSEGVSDMVARRGKPVTRGGKPISGPVTGRKTMAHARRQGKR